jgi:hypothetical protein
MPPEYTFRTERTSDGYRLSGVIDENADLGFLRELHGHVSIHLGAVRRINSFGVRQWIEAIRATPADARLEFLECPAPVVDQINMVAGFLGRGHVVSFYAPMVCESCKAEESALFHVIDCKRNNNRLPPFACPSCNKKMVVDELEEQYLLFLHD